MQPCEQHDKIKHIEDDLANHKEWRREITTMLTDIKVLCATTEQRLKQNVETIEKHIHEGERQGGWRDRLVVVEQKLVDAEKTENKRERDATKLAIISGIIGGLIGAGAPSAVKGLAHLVGI